VTQKLKKQFDEEQEKRRQAIQDAQGDNFSKLEKQLTDIEHDILVTQTKLLKELISRENVDAIFAVEHENEIGEKDDFKDIKRNEYFVLLKFLIRNGHIDETYADYMTHFYEDSISINDKTFLRRITDRRGAEYIYALKEPKKVIESSILRNVEFEQEEVLNFDLFESLLINAEYNEYLKIFIAQIRDKRNFDFIAKFYDTDKAREQFVVKMNELWAEFFSLVKEGGAIAAEQIKQFSIDTLYFCNNESIEIVNVEECLTEYISNTPDYLRIEQPNITKLISGFSHIGVSFYAVDYDASDKELFNEVYRNCLYELTFDNITLMLQKMYGINKDSDIVHRNYTLVQKHSDSPLATYISKNMMVYMKVMLDNGGSISDEEEMVVKLLNNVNVDDPEKERYIKALSTTINDIGQVNEPKLWIVMIDRGIVSFSVTNFVLYFRKNGLDKGIIRYVNDTQSEINFTTVEDDFGKDVAVSLYDAVAICNAMNNNKYKKILTDLGYYFDTFTADSIESDKLEILIVNEILRMDKEGLTFVRDKYSESLLMFIKKNLDEYCGLQTNELFSLEEVLKIIIWDVADEKKIELLAYTKEPLSVVEKGYTDAVNAHIISNNFNPADKQYLYKNYSQYGQQTQATIVQIAVTVASINEIIAQNMELDDDLMSIIFQTDTVARERRIKIFTGAIPRLNEETCKRHFEELELSELNGIFTKSGGRKNYAKSQDIKTVLATLKVHGWIHDFYDDDRNNERYVIVKNKPRKELEILD